MLHTSLFFCQKIGAGARQQKNIPTCITSHMIACRWRARRMHFRISATRCVHRHHSTTVAIHRHCSLTTRRVNVPAFTYSRPAVAPLLIRVAKLSTGELEVTNTTLGQQHLTSTGKFVPSCSPSLRCYTLHTITISHIRPCSQWICRSIFSRIFET